MYFLNEIGKKTSKACHITADKTNKLAKEAKHKMKMAEYKSQISDLYEKIGKKVYENHICEEKQNVLELVLEECVEIDKLASQIEETRKELLYLRNKKQCPNCFLEIKEDYRFCPNCGTLQQEKSQKSDNTNPEIKIEGLEPIDIPKKEEEKINLE